MKRKLTKEDRNNLKTAYPKGYKVNSVGEIQYKKYTSENGGRWFFAFAYWDIEDFYIHNKERGRG